MVFHTFFNLSLNFAMRIWATVSSMSCFHWLHRASPSSATKNIINLISVLTIWWCPCVKSSLVLLDQGVCYDQCVLLAKLLASALLHSVLLSPNLPVPPDISRLPNFAYQSPMIKRNFCGFFLLLLALEVLIGLHRTCYLQFLWHQ